MTSRKRLLYFLCTGNSARSQMAEGYARRMAGPGIEVASAGLRPRGVHPLAVEVMREDGVDISEQTSDPIDPELLARADLVITLCGDAQDSCPLLSPEHKSLHWPLPDPAAVQGPREARLAAFREVRDRIRRLVGDLMHEETNR